MTSNKDYNNVTNSIISDFSNIKIGSSDETTITTTEHIYFANMKNYYTANDTTETDTSGHIDRNSYPTEDGNAKLYDLIPLDISFNEFANLFYNPYSHAFNINVTNKENKYIVFNYQHHQNTNNVVEQINLVQNFQQAWSEKNNKTLNEMSPKYRIMLRKYCYEHNSLYHLHGNTYSITIIELINEMVENLQTSENSSLYANCILAADVYIDFLDILIRYNFNYNVQFNNLDVDEEEEALNNEDISFEELLEDSDLVEDLTI